jgi:single-stranded DNA-binding protein
MLALTATGYVSGQPKIENSDYGDSCTISIRCKGDGGKHIFYVNAKFYGKKMDPITKYIKDGDQVTVTGTVSLAKEKIKKDETRYTQVYMTGSGFTLPPHGSPIDGSAPRQSPQPSEEEVPF